MKKYVLILLIALVALSIFLALKTDKLRREPEPVPAEQTGGASGTFAKLSENAVVVLEQRLTDTVYVNAINMEKPGFVIVYRDSDGKPGGVIGVSKWFPAGQYANEDIGLTESMVSGVDYYAGLVADDGNGIFDPKKDLPVENFAGDIIAVFQASKNAPDPKGVQIYY